MGDKKKSEKNKKNSSVSSEYATYALTGGKTLQKGGATVPSEESVISAKQFVESNKK